MPEKRPRESSASLQHEPLSIPPSPKRSRSTTPNQQHASVVVESVRQPSIFDKLWSSVAGVTNMWGRQPQSRSQMRAERSLAGQNILRNGAPKPRGPPTEEKKGGVLALLMEADNEKKRLANGEDAVASTSSAGPSQSSKQGSRTSSRSRPTSQERQLQHSTFFFDEGALRSGRPTLSHKDSVDSVADANDDLEEGTASQPIDLVDESDDETEAGTCPPLPPTPLKTLRRPPSRPNLSTHIPPSRDYGWLAPDLQSPSPFGSPTSERERRRKRSGAKGTNLRNDRQRAKELMRHQSRIISKAVEGGGPGAKSAGERVKKYFFGLSPARRNEEIYNEAVNKGAGSREAFEKLLGTLGPGKTVDQVITKTEPTFSPARQRKKADAVKTAASLHRTSSVSDIIDRLNKTELEAEEKIKARLRPVAPTRMSESRRQKVISYLRDKTAVFKCGNQEVNNQSLNRLRAQQWLNDEIINYYGLMIQQRSETSAGYKNVHFFNSFFYQKLSEDGYEKARLGRWTKRSKTDIFSKDAVLFPLNLSNAHWTAVCINMAKKRVEYYDSMWDGGKRHDVYKRVMEYLGKEHQDKKGKPFDTEGWKLVYVQDSPKQDNGCDCGVFSCQTLEIIARGRDTTLADGQGFDFTCENMPYIRDLMIYEIAQGHLEPRWPKEK